MATKKNTAPRADYATKPVTPLMHEFCDFIERETGVNLDADARRAVYLGSALRSEFQKANRAEKEAKPAPRARKGSTIAAPGHDGKPVVIAEQRHVEVA